MAAQPRRIRSVAVLGAGTMGAQIAAHFANAGVAALLLDVTPEIAREGLARAVAARPDPFFVSAGRALVRTGGLDTDLDAIASADWIIEAVVERLEVKQALFDKVETRRAPTAIVSSNTSGIPIAAIVDGRSPAFAAHALGTHFFNPPRYLHLLEVIPTPATDPSVVETVCRFADHRLGKGVVIAKDTPNFIANHLGLYGLMQIFRAWSSGGYSIEEIDAMTGPAIGRPKSATFRTMDLAGIDVLAHVVRNLAERLPNPADRAVFALPPVVQSLIDRGWVGTKAGQGFYKKDEGGEILTLDPASMTYRPKQPARLAALEAARSIDDVGARIKRLFLASDTVGAFLRETLGSTLIYTSRVAPEIAHSPLDVDRAMRWGFGWELGPFETCRAIGVEEVVRACGSDLATGWHVAPPEATGDSSAVASAKADIQILRAAKDRTAIVKRNAGASLVDIGDGVLAVEFHSKMNAIGGDTIQMLQAGVKEATANFRALVVGNDAVNFSAGANLMLLLLEAQEENWDEVDLMVRAFQSATMALRYADVPVAIAPAGLVLGGGCEIVLHGDRVQAAAESYIGLVEVGVGLIPAGGGTKEMLSRAMESSLDRNLLASSQRVFETIGFARVSTSAPDAIRHGYLRAADGVTMNRDRLMADAKNLALARADDYVRPQPRTAIPVGGESVLAALKLGVHLALRAGRISDHDALIGTRLARIIAGGDRGAAGTATEQELLDLEREAFLSLCGQAKTRERMQHMLKTGKPLRN